MSRAELGEYTLAMSLQPPLAHLGHWYLWAPYMVPVLVVLAAVGRAVWSERREQRREAAGKGNGGRGKRT
jgi:hypothetical protein